MTELKDNTFKDIYNDVFITRRYCTVQVSSDSYLIITSSSTKSRLLIDFVKYTLRSTTLLNDLPDVEIVDLVLNKIVHLVLNIKFCQNSFLLFYIYNMLNKLLHKYNKNK